MVDKKKKERDEEKRKEEFTEYVAAWAGILFFSLAFLSVATPWVFLIIGFSVRLFRWAAGGG